MNITVIGTGGVGGYFGGKLSQAGNEVAFLTRGKALEVIQNHGLMVKSYLGDFKVRPHATDDPACVAHAELVLLCTKSWQIEEVARQIKPHLQPNCMILPLQNGADNAERLMSILPREMIMGGLCKIVSKIESPGVIDHFTFVPEIVFGELDHSLSSRAETLQATFVRAGFKSRCSDNIHRDIWLKFLFICSISAMGALCRCVLGVMREDPFIRQKIRETGLEIVSVGQRLGIDIQKDDLESTFKMIDQGKYETTMSLQRDLMEGKPSELHNFNGFISEKGKALGVPTPVNDFIYHLLRPMEDAARKKAGID